MDLLDKVDQRLLIDIYHKGGTIRTYRDQSSLSPGRFYSCTKKLETLGLIRSSCQGREKVYVLRDCGKLLCVVILGKEKEKNYTLFI